MIVFLDSGVLGKLCNPNSSPETIAVNEWLFSLLSKGKTVVTNYICDYEVRRSLTLNSLKGFSSEGLQNLDALANIIEVLPLNDATFREAASIWAETRIQGKPTATERSLDADVIICAHWKQLKKEYPGRYAVIATTNVKHLSRVAEAKEWNEID
jgi:predicted nucleic acid-binding protein